jgi:bud site selection protein 20
LFGDSRRQDKHFSHVCSHLVFFSVRKTTWAGRTRDIDQIREVILDPKAVEKLASAKVDLDLPGMGLNFCAACSQHMIDRHVSFPQ